MLPLSPSQSAIFLGTFFAYPFHAQLRENFGIIPAAWLLSPDRKALQSVANFIHQLFFPSPEEIISFFANRPDIPAIVRRISVRPYEPWHLEDWSPTCTGFSQFLSLALDFGKLPSGIYGTTHYRIQASCPPFVTSNKAPSDPSQASRFLFFQLLSAPPTDTDPINLSSKICHASFEEIVQKKSYAKDAMKRAIHVERELATKTWLTLRQRIQLAIAYAYYTKADDILSEHPEDHELLLESITAPRAFDAPENLCV